jgi:hypothetical protein
MARIDLTNALRALVNEEVENALAPHREALQRISSFLGVGPTSHRGPGRQSAWGATGRTRRVSQTLDRGDASKFKEGQQVRYRQGRGEFEAKVVRIDSQTNTVTVQRVRDGKRVARPASKLYFA